MDPMTILAISQLVAMAAQGLTSVLTAKKQIEQNASQTDKDNLDQAHQNFLKTIASIQAAIAALSPAPAQS